MDQQVSFNADSIRKYSQQKRAARGYYPTVCTDAVPFDRSSEQGLPDGSQAKLSFKRVSDENDPNSIVKGAPNISAFHTFPVTIGDQDVLQILEEKERYPDMCLRENAKLLAAFYPEEVPQHPRWDKVRKQNFNAAGEPIAADLVDSLREEANAQGAKKASELVAGGQEALRDLIGRVIFVEVAYKEGGEFPNLRDPSNTAQKEVTEAVFEYSGGEVKAAAEEEEPEETPARRPVAAAAKKPTKPNGKPASKLGPTNGKRR